MRAQALKMVVAVVVGLALGVSPALADNKRVMSISAARVVAERNLVESVYGLKLRANESVEDMVAANFSEATESKTSAMISGIKYDNEQYDKDKDIAKVVASLALPSITNVDGTLVDLKGKTFRRIGFGTATPASAGPLKALRAAELDAYKQLMKRLVGFTLESQTSVENFMLKSDVIKTKVMATLFMSQLVDFGWDESGDAWMKLALNLKDLSEILGQKLAEPGGEVVEVTGYGAQAGEAAPPPTFPASARETAVGEPKR